MITITMTCHILRWSGVAKPSAEIVATSQKPGMTVFWNAILAPIFMLFLDVLAGADHEAALLGRCFLYEVDNLGQYSSYFLEIHPPSTDDSVDCRLCTDGPMQRSDRLDATTSSSCCFEPDDPTLNSAWLCLWL